MSGLSRWMNFLKCQKEILFHKLKIYGISKKIEDNYRMIGEEVYLFSQKPKSHKSVLSQGRVKFLLGEVNKDHEIINETEKEIFALKEQMMGAEPSINEEDVTDESVVEEKQSSENATQDVQVPEEKTS